MFLFCPRNAFSPLCIIAALHLLLQPQHPVLNWLLHIKLNKAQQLSEIPTDGFHQAKHELWT